MSDSKSRDLITLLQELGSQELDQESHARSTKKIRETLEVLMDSERSERVEYASYEFESSTPNAGARTVQGLALRQSGLLLTEFISRVGNLDHSVLSDLLAPAGFTPAQGRAAVHAAYWILNSLEWESRDQNVSAEYPTEAKERMIASRIRSLQAFRATGEP